MLRKGEGPQMVDHKICINVLRNLRRICLGRKTLGLIGLHTLSDKNHCSKLPHALTTLSGMLSILLTVRGPENRLVVLS